VLRTKQKQYNEAERFFDEALKGRQRELGDDHPHTLETKNDLAVLYKEQGRYEEAEILLLEAVEGRRLKLGDKHPHTQLSLNNLIALYEAWGKPEKAVQWRAKLPQTEKVEQ
jgi:tetratricopeptide (TPR) repeat protein